MDWHWGQGPSFRQQKHPSSTLQSQLPFLFSSLLLIPFHFSPLGWFCLHFTASSGKHGIRHFTTMWTTKPSVEWKPPWELSVRCDTSAVPQSKGLPRLRLSKHAPWQGTCLWIASCLFSSTCSTGETWDSVSFWTFPSKLQSHLGIILGSFLLTLKAHQLPINLRYFRNYRVCHLGGRQDIGTMTCVEY